MHIVRAPFFLRACYSEAIWRKSKSEKSIYLTFDDGPIPEITPWVLDLLKKENVKATFFCVGENIVKNPVLFQRLKDEGHAVGNHTYNHLRGWDTEDNLYLENIAKTQLLTQTRLFRPPYGRIKKSQSNVVKTQYDIIMWDVLTGDYDARISPEQCLKNSVNYTRNGSIIVFHDNIKAIKNLEYALPRAIETLKNQGFTFRTL